MSRLLTNHQLTGQPDVLEIRVLDEPGQGGACHRYAIRPVQMVNEHTPNGSQILRASCDIRFQNGPIQEVGVNGISGEALLAVLIDRMRGFQSGPYASEDNALALDFMICALERLQKRTRERLARGVEGTSAA